LQLTTGGHDVDYRCRGRPGSIASEETDRLIASDEVEGTARLAAIGIPSDATAKGNIGRDGLPAGRELGIRRHQEHSRGHREGGEAHCKLNRAQRENESGVLSVGQQACEPGNVEQEEASQHAQADQGAQDSIDHKESARPSRSRGAMKLGDHLL
jgi:hypothetical protein